MTLTKSNVTHFVSTPCKTSERIKKPAGAGFKFTLVGYNYFLLFLAENNFVNLLIPFIGVRYSVGIPGT